MSNEFRILDPEARAKNLAKLKEVTRQLDILNLMLDEAIALVDRDLLQQRRARLLYRSNYLPTEKIES
ncbi:MULTISPECIES: hypothetical protein [unclassified Chamaesiphon]|uniref:hypothetical protein n=1 Tax=unclassified Chamaesiphon TaxID=2620921 RepID=UPI00286C76AC|nr:MULTISPECIES: hypothetical protein [unclassified Chamaesiphon]